MQISSHCHFHCARGFTTPVLAQMLDSLVRVSRREKENHFVQVSSLQRQSKLFHCEPPTWTTPAAAPQPQANEEMRFGSHWFPLLPFQQVQVLFDSALARLCIFPSRYLYAIGLSPVFSLGWNLPPNWSCNPKQLDSTVSSHACGRTGVSPSTLPRSRGLCPLAERKDLQTTIRHK